jgi:hypothetical protein
VLNAATAVKTSGRRCAAAIAQAPPLEKPPEIQGPRAAAPQQLVRHPPGLVAARPPGEGDDRDHRLVQAAYAQRRLPQVTGPLDRPQPRLHARAEHDLVGGAPPQHVQNVVLGPGHQRRLTEPGAQSGGIALPPHAHHVLAAGQAGGVLGGGAAPAAGQHRPPAFRECFPAGRGPLGVGDGRIAAGDLLAVLDIGPDGEPVPGVRAVHMTNVVCRWPA